jgi:Protein of unknown function (DUF3833)
MMDLGLPGEDELSFRPDHFFLAPTAGRGVVRDRFGRTIDRCDIATEGRWDHNHGALHFDETYTYQNGRAETLNWAFSPNAQGRMTATEASVSSPVRGWRDGQDYRLQFKRLGAPPLERAQVRYDVRFTLMQPDMALKTVRLKLFGVTVGVLTAFHRRAG